MAWQEHAGVVYQRVNPAELLNRTLDDAVGNRRDGNIASDGQDICRGTRFDRSRVGDNPITSVEESSDESRTDSLRCPRDDHYLALAVHDLAPNRIRIPVRRVFWRRIFVGKRLAQTRVTVTSMLPRVAFEYGQV